MTRKPEPPRDVRVLLRDGTEVPVECQYIGWFDGSHRWDAVCPIGLVKMPQSGNPFEGVQVLADALPGHTTIGLRFTWEHRS